MSRPSAANAIRETLDTLLGPEVRVRVVLRALTFAGTDAIPAGGPALVAFVSRALAFALEEVVDRETARQTVERLWEMVREQDEQPESAPPETPRPAPGPEWSDLPTHNPRARATTQSVPRRRWPIVFLVTRDRDRLTRFKVALSGRAQVEAAADLFELVEGLDNTAGLHPILVVDCVSLGIPVDQLQPMLPNLTDNVTLVIWGVPRGPQVQQHLVDTFGQATIGCDSEATPEDVAMLLMPFVG
ncbi:MAG: hypothetical protein IT379_01700 [Deltaproteobacteria bacterium]|nr:hypothetical protein [Deltaproteobacteria bacterium]